MHQPINIMHQPIFYYATSVNTYSMKINYLSNDLSAHNYTLCSLIICKPVSVSLSSQLVYSCQQIYFLTASLAESACLVNIVVMSANGYTI